MIRVSNLQNKIPVKLSWIKQRSFLKSSTNLYWVNLNYKFSTCSKLLHGDKCLFHSYTGTKFSKIQYQNKVISPVNLLQTSRQFNIYSTKFDRNDEKPNFSDSLGTWDNKIDLPILMDASIKHGHPIPKVSSKDVGCSSLPGKRTYQEDRYCVMDLKEDLLCCAVFDGHGGSECSNYCSENIEEVIRKELDDHKDLQTVLHNSFMQLNSMYTKWVNTNQKGLRAGTTATVCLLRGGVELVVGHTGDSRALLCRLGTPRRLTDDHCPSLVTEKERVERSGGTVSTDNIGRHMVNNTLSMSRSIGDLHLKQYGVTAVPDTKSKLIKHGKDAFLLLTTDGINFILRDEEICDVVNNAEDPVAASDTLTQQALSMSSEDNCTAIVVPLGSWGKYTKSASMFYSFGIGRDMSKSSRFG